VPVHIRRALAGVPHRRGLVKFAAHADSIRRELSDPPLSLDPRNL
jgi:hypothetical protein